MNHEEQINPDGRAFNGNWGAFVPIGFIIGLGVLYGAYVLMGSALDLVANITR